MRRSSRGQRIVFRLPPYDTPRAARCNKAKFRVHRRHAAGGVCEQRNTALWLYVQDGGTVGFVDFTKILFALYSLEEPFNRVRSIPEYVFVNLSQHKACGGRFRKETAEKIP